MINWDARWLLKSNLLVVQTNSATFGLSAESAQQLAITRIRAIEHQREVVSVATSGISAVIDMRGRVIQRTAQDRAEVLAQDLSLNAKRSIADSLGAWMEWTLVLLPLLFWFIVSTMNRRRRIR